MEVSLGFIQPRLRFGDLDWNMSRIDRLAQALDSPDLIVLPELTYTGYLFRSREEALELGRRFWETSLEHLLRLSDRLSATVVAGVAEPGGDRLYNSAVVASKGELLGIYRKIHLFNEEKTWFDPGDRPPSIFDVGFRLGVMICFDWAFPEVARSLALQGADVIAHPSNLVFDYAYTATLVRARENSVYIVTANRVGMDDRGDKRLLFKGMSQIASPDMEPIYRARPYTEEAYTAIVDLGRARDKWITRRNHLLRDRRPELYLLGGEELEREEA